MNPADPWPTLAYRQDDSWHDTTVPCWVKSLAAFGRWLVVQSDTGVAWRAALVVPSRSSSALWLSLGGLFGVLELPASREVVPGATVWLMPNRGRQRFRQGVLEDVRHGLHWIRLNNVLEGQPRSALFFVQGTPTLERCRAASATEDLAGRLGRQIAPGRCLEAESSVLVGGGIHAVQSAASSLRLGERSMEELLLLSRAGAGGFSMTRLVDDTGEIGSNARLLVIDGPSRLHLIEDVRTSTTMLPAVVVLSEEEWFQALAADSSRIQNAFVNWGGERHEWPEDLPKIGLGGVLYRKCLAR